MEGFCRGCLIRYDEPTELVPYTERNSMLYKYSTGIQVKHHEVALFQLCKDCHVNMKLSCKFKKQCRTSDKKFKHYVSLKEAGDAYDLTTFLKSNDESLRFPLLNGSSTPQNPRVGSERENDDNESTCTSIRNFMSDILQGEEVPDTEAHLIKEVIEEDLLDDTLDSHLLDDISRDTDFRDLSFSPFSTPHTTNHDHCYSPYAENDAVINDYNNISVKDVPPLVQKDKTQDYPILETAEPTPHVENNIDQPEGLFEEIADENVNYVTQNENDIAVTNAEYDSIHNESFYAAKALQNENDQYRADTNCTKNQDSMAIKHLLESNVDNEYLASTNLSSCGIVATENIDINQFKNDKDKINFTLEVEKHIAGKGDPQTNESNKTENYVLKINQTDTSINVNHDELSGEGVKVTIVFEAINENKNDDDIQNKEDILEEFKIKADKDFTLDDLLVLPIEHSKAPGASTPLINNILFGEKLDLDEDIVKCDDKEQADKEVNVLDEMLSRGVKEFSIHTVESQAADVYDTEQCYCKTCDKKFKILKGLKLHLVKFHGIKLPRAKSRDFDKRVRICSICGATCNDFKSFLRHQKKHASPHECSICKIDFLSQATLRNHMKSHSSALHLVDENKEIKENRFLCKICGCAFKTAGNFAVHMNRHSQNYLVTCEDCGKGFYRKSDLSSHMRVHTGEKPFPCKFCDSSFRVKYSLVRHMKVHLDDKPFQCDGCSTKFVLKCDLVRHITNSKLCIRKRAGFLPPTRSVKKYECGYCNEKFSTRPEFLRHQKNYKPCKTLHSKGVWVNEEKSPEREETLKEIDEAAGLEDVEMQEEI
ncbi:unnamed protein product [Chilo suppressalis]|uniref:C2H2-type domain-containing protein n=1 Tax=Chilo suppressalis TaxID=168631 RepID=A0ABN8B3F7_CHISP|nr:unnamed protein product [Chilo suppressalis]